MKRTLSFFLMIAFLLPLSASVSYIFSNQTGNIPLNAFVNEYVILRVEPISSDGNSLIGMPFDITATDVDYSSTASFQGRKIADWAFATNCNTANLRITVSPLVNNEDVTPTTVNYYMTFSYRYVRVDQNDVETPFFGYIQIDSKDNSVIFNEGNESAISYNGTTGTITLLSSGKPVISMDCDIRLRLHNYTPAQKADWDPGYYYGDVLFEFSGE